MTATLDRPRTGERIARRTRPHVLGELLVVLFLLRVYDMARAAAAVRQHAALQHGWALLRIEAAGHLDVERAVNAWTASHSAISLTATDFYQFVHVPLTLLLLVLCWWRRPDLYRTARNQLVAINVIGLTVFLLLPVAPPRLLPGGGFVDTVAAAGFGSSHGGPVAADQYGALPSLHLAWAAWVTMLAARMVTRTALRRALWAYPLVVTAVVVMTGNHYLLDAVAGTAVAVAVVAVPQLARQPLRSVVQRPLGRAQSCEVT